MTEGDNFQPAFLKLNANPEFISSVFVDMVRDCVRAGLAEYPNSRNYEAVNQIKFFLDLLKATEQQIPLHALVDAVEKNFKSYPDEDELDIGLYRVVREAVYYFLEMTSADNLAGGRQSQRRDRLVRSIQAFSREAGA